MQFMSGLAGVIFGLASGNLLSVAMPYFERSLGFTSVQIATLVTSSSVAAVATTFFAGHLTDFIGRRKTFSLSALLYSLAVLLVALSDGSYATIISGISMQGVSLGLLGVVAPLYLAECMPPENRGKATAFFQFTLIVGIALSGLLGLAVAYLIGPSDSETMAAAEKIRAWKTLYWVSLVPGVILFLGAFKLNESPLWLSKKGGKSKALSSTCNSSLQSKESLPSIFSGRYVVPFLIVFVILACNKLIGMPYIACYSVKIFQMSGLAGAAVNWADFVFKTVMLISTAIACLLVDKRGRRFLLTLGTTGVFVAMLMMGIAFWGIDRGSFEPSSLTGYAVAFGVVLFIAFYSLGPGVCVWLVMTELLPSRIRAVGMSIVLFINNFASTAMLAIFLPVGERIGYGILFFACAASAGIYLATVRIFMPETKGRALDEIEAEFARKYSPSTSEA